MYEYLLAFSFTSSCDIIVEPASWFLSHFSIFGLHHLSQSYAVIITIGCYQNLVNSTQSFFVTDVGSRGSLVA